MYKLDFLKNGRGLIIIAIAGIIIGGISGFIAGMEFKAYQIRSVITETFNRSFAQTAESESETLPPVIKTKMINEEIELATIKFKVNKVKEQQTISGNFGRPQVASQNSKFVIIDMDITNLTSDPFNFYSDGFVIQDAKNRNFNPYSDVIGNIKNYLDVRELSPGILENGAMVFEIPSDSVTYALIVGKAGTNEIYKISLN